MKSLRYLSLSVLAASIIAVGGCSDDGDQGPQGPAGANGTNGANGVDGANGAAQVLSIGRIGRSQSTSFDEGAAEIVQYEASSERIFTINGSAGTIDVFDVSGGLTTPALSNTIDIKQMLVDNSIAANIGVVGGANSISIRNGIAAVAVEANPKTNPGWIVFINTSDLTFRRAAQVGALPDMVTITPDGTKAVAALEGEPEDYTVDPEGGVAIVNIADGAVTTALFTDFNRGATRAAELPADLRRFGRIVDADGTYVRDTTVAEDIEPEYVAINATSTKAYASLQENNGLAVVDLTTGAVEKICALGFKDHRLPGNALDTGDRDGASTGNNPLVNISKPNGPLYGMYMPDTIATYQVNGVDYVVMANEGDSRADWGIDPAGAPTNINVEEARVSALTLDDTRFPLVNGIAQTSQLLLGRLNVTRALEIDSDDDGVRDRARGDTDGDGDFDALYTFGGRSFAIFRPDTCQMVYESGDDFETITARRFPTNFNADSTGNDLDNRSDNKGPEPEALVLGVVNGHTYAFIGLERMGGLMVYDISNPHAPTFVQYHTDRDFTLEPDLANAIATLDLAPEGLTFVDANDSPTGKPLVVAGNEVSGNVSIYEVGTTLLQE